MPPSTRIRDYRQDIRVRLILPVYHNIQTSELLVTQQLPQGWSLENGMCYFLSPPIPKIMLNGIDYNPELSLTEEEQWVDIRTDLMKEGFSVEEIEEILTKLPRVQEHVRFFSFDASSAWLREHPLMKAAALHIVQEATQQAEHIQETAFRERRRR